MHFSQIILLLSVKVVVFSQFFQYAEEVQCINTKFNEKINEDERNEMKLTGSMALLHILTVAC